MRDIGIPSNLTFFSSPVSISFSQTAYLGAIQSFFDITLYIGLTLLFGYSVGVVYLVISSLFPFFMTLRCIGT